MENNECDFELLLNTKKKKRIKKLTNTDNDGVTNTDNDGVTNTDNEDYTYTDLLSRIYSNIQKDHPNIVENKRFKIPTPQLVRTGRKTVWINFNQVSCAIHRKNKHVMDYILSELIVDGSININSQLILQGIFRPIQIESLLKKYIMEYVSCQMCLSLETVITKNPITRLEFLQCGRCNASRSVLPIKSGYRAINKKTRCQAKKE
jgi:translation initiation factor 2 subunit 2